VSPEAKPVVLLCPAPQSTATIFDPADRARLHDRYDVREVLDPGDPAVDAALPECFAVIGQIDLPRSRLDAAPGLRAVLNVEGNFYPNVDYAACFDRGVHVLSCGPAYAQAVAEYALGLALDLARGISREDRAFRRGEEAYLAAGNVGSILLRDSRIGLLGFGALGRALLPLLRPFGAELAAHDPWLPDSVLRAEGLRPCSPAQLLSSVDLLFVLASTTTQNAGLLDATALARLPDGARLVLVSRAAVVDFDALHAEVHRGRLLAAVDVWPEEPMPPDAPLRREEGVVLSAHRAGAVDSAFRQIGAMVLDDLRQIEQGLPPVRMQVAARELVDRYRNKPAAHPPVA
jgi:phosphoglycerate dehydrogenase-like enzyme